MMFADEASQAKRRRKRQTKLARSASATSSPYYTSNLDTPRETLRGMTGPPRPPPEFPYFPFKTWRVNPPYLEGQVRHADPWGKRDAWRYNEFFSKQNRIRQMAPGLGIATVAFAIYVAYDKWYETSGPGKEENEKWARWMEEREKRIGGSHGHGHH